MKKAIPIIHEDVEMLENRLKLEKDFRRKLRLHMLYLLKSGSCRTRLEVAETLAIHRNTIGLWLKRYEHGGLNALMTIEDPGAKPGQKTLPQADLLSHSLFAHLMVIDSLTERLKEESGFRSYGEIQRWLFHTHRLEVNYKTVYRIVRYDMKAKLKVPRKSHKKKNEQEVEDFKEDIESHLLGVMGDTPMSCVQILVQDESRFGLLAVSQRRITAKGTKPIQVVNPRYESYYLYGAVAPGTGEHLFLEMPALNSSCLSNNWQSLTHKITISSFSTMQVSTKLQS